ncbi:hypothetical protein [Sphingorhabdus sp. EL138]|uniref:COG4223 family protein n=1 Tax=Sphingorhabdus sp. EL138 TaxID=2073156 RepID=UPI0025F74B08|nr:hypothetical protein [Sphingorhabdus sp. EL138]
MTDYPTAQTGSAGGMKFKYFMLLLFFAFSGGAAATWWLADSFGILAPTAQEAAEAENIAAPLPSINLAPARLAAAGATVQVEGQAVPVYVTDPAISGDAVRGEGLLLTFAVRRRLDNGASLGYLAEQLRLRFGATQPQAVATIISAAQAPVTIDKLQTELSELAPILVSSHRDNSVWETVKRELSQLFVLRRDDGSTRTPEQRLIRAQAFVEAGNLSAALSEVTAMPGAPAAQPWMIRAKRYADARKALDRLEQMALIRPVVLPVTMPAPAQAPAAKASATP